MEPASGYQSQGSAVPSAPYSRRAPSPAFIPLPAFRPQVHDDGYAIYPTEEILERGYSYLSPHQLRLVLPPLPQVAHDSTLHWEYANRRQAQRILDTLYVGPTSVIRDVEWLRETGITMIIAIHDVRMAQFVKASINRVAGNLGIVAQYISISSVHDLIGNFQSTIDEINQHLLDTSFNVGPNEDPYAPSTQTTLGKILVTCETGNDRSIALVSAYLMAMFGLCLEEIVQYVVFLRFCATFDEQIKRLLVTWWDILAAQRSVSTTVSRSTHDSRFVMGRGHDHYEPGRSIHPQYNYRTSSSSSHASSRAQPHHISPSYANPRHYVIGSDTSTTRKRRIRDVYDVEGGENDHNSSLDNDRYADREAFVPFVDRNH